MCSVAAPELVTVTLCAGLVLPWVVLAKVKLPGVRVTAGSGEAPVPLTGIDCGLPGALSVAARLAWRVPAARGEKTTLMLQVAFGARTVGNEQLGVETKSEGLAPVTPTELRLSDWPPVLVSVTSLELLDCPTVTGPKSSDAWENRRHWSADRLHGRAGNGERTLRSGASEGRTGNFRELAALRIDQKSVNAVVLQRIDVGAQRIGDGAVRAKA